MRPTPGFAPQPHPKAHLTPFLPLQPVSRSAAALARLPCEPPKTHPVCRWGRTPRVTRSSAPKRSGSVPSHQFYLILPTPTTGDAHGGPRSPRGQRGKPSGGTGSPAVSPEARAPSPRRVLRRGARCRPSGTARLRRASFEVGTRDSRTLNTPSLHVPATPATQERRRQLVAPARLVAGPRTKPETPFRGAGKPLASGHAWEGQEESGTAAIGL